MKHSILFILSAVVLTGCRHDIQAIFPDTLIDETTQYMQEHEYMVVIYLDSANCSPCLLNEWKPYKRVLEKKNTGILLIFHNLKEQTVVNTLKSINATFHFIIDNGYIFRANSEIFKFDTDNIFVMDKNRNLIMAESPIKNEKTWLSFTKLIAR